MKSARILIVLVVIAAGFLAGRLTAPCPKPLPADGVSPGDAFEGLRTYRGQGARAALALRPLIEATAAGGEEMLPEIEKALAEGRDFDYRLPMTADFDQYLLALPRTRRLAMLDAVGRIGGDDGVRILIEAGGNLRAATEERAVADLLLARHADRPDVREHYAKQLNRILVTHTEDQEAMWLLRASRGHLDAALFGDVMKAFVEGWLSGVDPQSVYAELGETLASLDEERAQKLFLRLIADPAEVPKARAAAAMCLARMPGARPQALEILLRPENQELLRYYVKGGKHSRYGEPYRIRAADESKDPKVRAEFLAEWLDVQRQFAAQMEEIAARAQPQVLRTLDLEANRAFLAEQIRGAEARLKHEQSLTKN
jgi:hypothetical protein